MPRASPDGAAPLPPPDADFVQQCSEEAAREYASRPIEELVRAVEQLDQSDLQLRQRNARRHLINSSARGKVFVGIVYGGERRDATMERLRRATGRGSDDSAVSSAGYADLDHLICSHARLDDEDAVDQDGSLAKAMVEAGVSVSHTRELRRFLSFAPVGKGRKGNALNAPHLRVVLARPIEEICRDAIEVAKQQAAEEAARRAQETAQEEAAQRAAAQQEGGDLAVGNSNIGAARTGSP
jgi:hypothetical protein